MKALWYLLIFPNKTLAIKLILYLVNNFKTIVKNIKEEMYNDNYFLIKMNCIIMQWN